MTRQRPGSQDLRLSYIIDPEIPVGYLKEPAGIDRNGVGERAVGND
jgi:hypothetical protein